MFSTMYSFGLNMLYNVMEIGLGTIGKYVKMERVASGTPEYTGHQHRQVERNITMLNIHKCCILLDFPLSAN